MYIHSQSNIKELEKCAFYNFLLDAYNLLMNWKLDTCYLVCLTGNDGVTFTTLGSTKVDEEADGHDHTQSVPQEQQPTMAHAMAGHRKQSKGG